MDLNETYKILAKNCVKKKGFLRHFTSSQPYCKLMQFGEEKACPYQGDKMEIRRMDISGGPLEEDRFGCNLKFEDDKTRL